MPWNASKGRADVPIGRGGWPMFRISIPALPAAGGERGRGRGGEAAEEEGVGRGGFTGRSRQVGRGSFTAAEEGKA